MHNVLRHPARNSVFSEKGRKRVIRVKHRSQSISIHYSRTLCLRMGDVECQFEKVTVRVAHMDCVEVIERRWQVAFPE